MEIATLVALTITAVQALKSKLAFIPAIVLTILVSLMIVAVKAFESGMTFNLALLWLWVQVLLGSIGAYKIANAAVKKQLDRTPA